MKAERVRPRRQRIAPPPTTRDVLWRCRALHAKLILDRPHQADYVAVNDLVASCQRDIESGDPRPEWLDALEELADDLERASGGRRLELIRGGRNG